MLLHPVIVSVSWKFFVSISSCHGDRLEIRRPSPQGSSVSGVRPGILRARRFAGVGWCHPKFFVLNRGQLPSPRRPPRHHWTVLEGRILRCLESIRPWSRTALVSGPPAVPPAVLQGPESTPACPSESTSARHPESAPVRVSELIELALMPEFSAPACLSELLDMALPPEFSAPILSPESTPVSTPAPDQSRERAPAPDQSREEAAVPTFCQEKAPVPKFSP